MLPRASRLGNVIEIVIAGLAAAAGAAAGGGVAAVADAGITDVAAVTAAMVVMEAAAKGGGVRNQFARDMKGQSSENRGVRRGLFVANLDER